MLRLSWNFILFGTMMVLIIQFVVYVLRSQNAESQSRQNFGQSLKRTVNQVFQRRPVVHDEERAKATFVILARNSDLEGLRKTLPMLENRFNKRFGYPYVFLNDVPFTEEFKTSVKKLSNSIMYFGTIPREHWSYPSWINTTMADAARADMESRHIIYGGSLSYRHMCRFNSGFFFRHPLLESFEYYWRVEPYVEFYCDVEYDPFLYMKKNNKKYGFVIMLHEYAETIPTLWSTTKNFIQERKDLINEEANSLGLIRRGDGSYNGCHFWSNFEIASLDFLRSEKYMAYFDYLDKAGGFFYERWGDAPVHSIGAAMFLPIKEIHYFEDIGYYHGPFYNCPINPSLQLNCNCDPGKNVNYNHECFKIFRQLSKP